MMSGFYKFQIELISDLEEYFPDVSLDCKVEFTGYGEYHKDMANIIVNGHTFLVTKKCGTWIFFDGIDSETLEQHLNQLTFRDALQLIKEIDSF